MAAPASVQILGIQFFNGTASEAVNQMLQNGGLLVAPSGTCFERFVEDESYRRAILAADVALADSGFMVSLARLRGLRVTRISGLTYLQELIRNGAGGKQCDVDLRLKGEEREQRINPQFEIRNVFWVLPSEHARDRLIEWGRGRSVEIEAQSTYVAPFYGDDVADPALLKTLNELRPPNIVIGIGAGPQEKLGYYLRENLAYRSAIHCIGGALGFITGDQVAIPDWADRLYLGWLLRLLSQPRVFIPRLARARVLPWLITKYGDRLPAMKKMTKAESGKPKC